MLQLLEEVRIEAFWRHDGGVRAPYPTAVLDAGPGAEVTTLVARQEIEYLRPLAYRRAPVPVELWIGRLGGASIEVCYEVRDDDPAAEPYARAAATLVLVEAATGRPRRIGDVERAAWEPYVEAPIAFRHRR
jgi:acyl-CoA thioester hydrolase